MNSTYLIPSLGDPLALFAQFHQRTRQQCADIGKLGERLHDVGMDAVACDAATAITYFFDHDANLHHEDEELVLFPMLRALKIDADEKADFDQLMQILTDDHELLGKAWKTLRSSLLSIAKGRLQWVAVDVTTFSALYRHHLNCEDIGIMPFARRHLDQPNMDELRQALVARRAAR